MYAPLLIALELAERRCRTCGSRRPPARRCSRRRARLPDPQPAELPRATTAGDGRAAVRLQRARTASTTSCWSSTRAEPNRGGSSSSCARTAADAGATSSACRRHRAAAARRCTGRSSAATPPTRSPGCSPTCPHVALEAPTEEREEAIQSGGAHYAESLPVEYQPDAEYQRLFDAGAGRVGRRDWRTPSGWSPSWCWPSAAPAPVLASLARAGTPVGILMRRWARFAHGVDLPHYAVSIVRGRGIDRVALR